MTDLPIPLSYMANLSSSLEQLAPPFPLPSFSPDPESFPQYLMAACNMLMEWTAAMQSDSTGKSEATGRNAKGKAPILLRETKVFEKTIRTLQRDRDRLEEENEQLRKEVSKLKGEESKEDELARNLIVNMLKRSLEGKDRMLQQKDRELAKLHTQLQNEMAARDAATTDRTHTVGPPGLSVAEARTDPPKTQQKNVSIQSGVAYFLFRPAEAQTDTSVVACETQTDEQQCDMPYTTTDEDAMYVETLDTSQQLEPAMQLKDSEDEFVGTETRHCQTEEDIEDVREQCCETEKADMEEKAVGVEDWRRDDQGVQTDRYVELRDVACQTSNPRCFTKFSQTSTSHPSLEVLEGIDLPTPLHTNWSSATQTPQAEPCKPSEFGCRRMYQEKTQECEDLHRLLYNTVSLPVSPQCGSLNVSKSRIEKSSRRMEDSHGDLLRDDYLYSPKTPDSPCTLDLSSLRVKLQARETCLGSLTERLKTRERHLLEKEQNVRRRELMLAGVVLRKERREEGSAK